MQILSTEPSKKWNIDELYQILNKEPYKGKIMQKRKGKPYETITVQSIKQCLSLRKHLLEVQHYLNI